MSHRLTCFISLLALAVGFWFGVWLFVFVCFPPLLFLALQVQRTPMSISRKF